MSQNPLKQYFRRPAIYIRLPSDGKYYDESIIEIPENQELPVYPMTAIDEITSKTPDAVFNGQAIVDIIESCIPNIKNAWGVNSIDIDALLIAIRVASNGDYMDITSKCPSCETENDYEVNLINILKTKKSVDYDQSLLLGDLEIYFRPLSYLENNKNSMKQYDIQKTLIMIEEITDDSEKAKLMKEAISKMNDIMITVISQTIAYIKTPETVVSENQWVLEFLSNCDRNTMKSIQDHSLKLRDSNQLKPIKLKCLACQHEYDQSLILNVTDFFD